jgi:hypothetical protein
MPMFALTSEDFSLAIYRMEVGILESWSLGVLGLSRSGAWE